MSEGNEPTPPGRFKVQLCRQSKKRRFAGERLKKRALSVTRRLGENWATVRCLPVDTCGRRRSRNPFPPDEGNAAVDMAAVTFFVGSRKGRSMAASYSVFATAAMGRLARACAPHGAAYML